MQLDLGLLHLEGDYITDLTAHALVNDSRLLHDGASAINLRVEPHLIVQNHDELAFEPSLDLPLFLAVGMACAHLESKGELLGLLRVVVSPDHHVFLFDALELFAVSVELIAARF